jgi:Zn-dependent protease with chaperone function
MRGRRTFSLAAASLVSHLFSPRRCRAEETMNYFKTAILLAGLTALFMAVGALIGGQAGMLIALVFAAATNIFSYWNSDKLVLSVNGAEEVDEKSAPELFHIVRDLAGPRRPSHAARLCHGEPAAKRFRDQPQPGTRGRLRDHRAPADAEQG